MIFCALDMQKTYTQTFRRECKQNTELKGWIDEIKNNSSKAHCNVCRCALTAEITDLSSHSNYNKHDTAETPV